MNEWYRQWRAYYMRRSAVFCFMGYLTLIGAIFFVDMAIPRMTWLIDVREWIALCKVACLCGACALTVVAIEYMKTYHDLVDKE